MKNACRANRFSEVCVSLFVEAISQRIIENLLDRVENARHNGR
jgi:hypothetical protein